MTLKTTTLPLKNLINQTPFYLIDPFTKFEMRSMTANVYHAGTPRAAEMDQDAEVWVMYACDAELARIQKPELRQMPVRGEPGKTAIGGIVNSLESDWF
jgi:hypothetical protein